MADDHAPVCFQHVESLIREVLIPKNITDPSVLNAFRRVPREIFLPPKRVHQAYDNMALDIGFGQTISQPLMIALMLQALDAHPDHHVLEIGAGSGYQAALLSHMVSDVISVERIPGLAEQARSRLVELGRNNISVVVGDGSQGWSLGAPYDRIIVSCAAPRVPVSLKDQLAHNGKLLIPVGSRDSQTTTLVIRDADAFREIALETCKFVPLIGLEGWQESADQQ